MVAASLGLWQETIKHINNKYGTVDSRRRKTRIHLQYTLTWACSGSKPHTCASDVPTK